MNNNFQTIYARFEYMAKQFPERIAVVNHNCFFTYDLLDKLVNRLAQEIHSSGDNSSFIMLFLDKSEWSLIAMLAVLKSGKAYVPLDPSWPAERIKYIINDTGSVTVITNIKDISILTKCGIKNILHVKDLSNKSNIDKSPSTVEATDVAYIIYTSGTTGQPKGTMIEHKGVINLCCLSISEFGLKATDCKRDVLWYSNYVFDAHVFEVFAAILNGHTLHLVDKVRMKDLEYLEYYISTRKIYIALLPPILLDRTRLLQLQTLILGGDKTPKDVLNYYYNSGIKVINAYGPTEVTVFCTYKVFDGNSENNIGFPINNTQIFVLGDQYKSVAPGDVGNLYVAGCGIARGYINQEALTRASFVCIPSLSKERLYKTGDLVRLQFDGSLEYIGREDSQIKLRGHRVELDEIQCNASKLPEVLHSVASIKKNSKGIDVLVLYYVTDKEYHESEGLVDTWKELYDKEYIKLNKKKKHSQFTGWNSSYTNKPYSVVEMQKWLDSTVKRILALQPKKLLEIGCGSGMIFSSLVERCDQYWATDFSESSIAYIENIKSDLGVDSKVTTTKSNALDLDIPCGVVDTIVLNSIIQYFPDITYLDKVLRKCIKSLGRKGQIFIGDVRDYRLMECFQYSIQKFKHDEFSFKDISFYCLREKELLISPGYFVALTNTFKEISTIEILPKVGGHNTEMNNYRYDVIIKIETSEHIKIQESEAVLTYDFDMELLDNSYKDYFLIKYPNKRIWEDYVEFCSLSRKENHLHGNAALYSLEEIEEKAKKIKFAIKFFNTINDPEFLYIVLYDPRSIVNKDIIIQYDMQKSGDSLNNIPYISKNILADKIKSHLSNILPDYMVPNHYIKLDSIPTNLSGKVNVSLLPDIIHNSGTNYAPPANAIENELVKIWQEIMAIDTIGVNDDFISLGGDSIVSIQLISLVRRKLNINLSVNDIFKYKTVKNLSKVLNVIDKSGVNKSSITDSDMKGPVPLLPIQKWFFLNNFVAPNHWNQSFLTRVPQLDTDKLESVLEKLVLHHDAFKLRFRRECGKIVQYYKDDCHFNKLKKLDIRNIVDKQFSHMFDNSKDSNKIDDQSLKAILTKWQSEFNIADGPIYCFGYIYGFDDGSARIFVAIHHLVVDAVCWRLFIEDLQDLYNNIELPEKTNSYKQWTTSVLNYAKKKPNEKSYWDKKLEKHQHDKKLEDLVIDAKTRNYRNIFLNEFSTNKLIRECNQVYNTQINDLLLGALACTLRDFLGGRDHFIAVEGHGREDIDSNIDVSRTMGYFTTLYPVHFESDEITIKTIINVKEELRTIPNKGIGYGAIIGYEQYKLPKICFNYLGQFDKKSDSDSNLKYWTMCRENSGVFQHLDNIDNSIINIIGVLIDGKLSFDITTKMSDKNTDKFSNLLLQNIEEIIYLLLLENRTYLTPSDINNVITQSELDALQNNACEIENVYLANSLQQGFVYHSISQGMVDASYHVQTLCHYNQAINVENMKIAWKYAIEIFDALRLGFSWEYDVIQVIHKTGELVWEYLNYVELSNQEAALKQLLETDKSNHFDLKQKSLFRVTLIKYTEDSYKLLFSNHHAILDGWGCVILFNEVHKLYSKICSGLTPCIDKDFAYSATQKYLQHNTKEHNLFWQDYLAEISSPLDLSGLFKDSSKHVRLSDYKKIIQPMHRTWNIKGHDFIKLQKFTHQYGVTIGATLQYIWHRLLHIYSGSSHTVVGTTVSGRNLPIDSIENSVGLYINTLPLVVDHSDGELTNLDRIKLVQESIGSINSKSNVNLASLQTDGKRIFDSLFVYANYPSNSDASIKFELEHCPEKLDYPLAVLVKNLDDCLQIRIKYAGEIFDEAAVKRITQVLEKLLYDVINNPNEKLGSVINFNEYSKVVQLEAQNQQLAQNNILELFNEQVFKSPNNIAVVFEQYSITYQELDQLSNAVANQIITKNVGANSKIGLGISRSITDVIGIIGVLKSGAAFVPISYSHPEEYLEQILKIANVSLCLVTDDLHALFERLTDKPIINIERIESKKLSLAARSPIKTNDLAYVIFTSGTTGQPKGVMIEHRSIYNYIRGIKSEFNFDSNDKHLLVSELIFDLGFTSLFGALLTGGQLHILSGEEITRIHYVADYLVNQGITSMKCTPSYFRLLMEHCRQNNFRLNRSLVKLILGGEKLSVDIINWLSTEYTDGKLRLFNHYGPTETTIGCIITEINYSDGRIRKQYTHGSIIGRPIKNLYFYVMDERNNLLPPDAIGTLYIGGPSLARGYIDNDELTAEKFIEDPLQPGYKVYNTGDLVRYSSNGVVEFLGRNDRQVKTNGYRVELQAIENILRSNDDVRDVVVIPRRGTRDVVEKNAYVISGEFATSAEELIEFLADKLPKYMIPEHFIIVDEFPLTKNGKLDISKLPEKMHSEKTYVAPRNKVEEKLCLIWSEVLGFQDMPIGITDDFFKLGGDSIAIIRMINRIQTQLSMSLAAQDVFEYRTIESLQENVLKHSTHTEGLNTIKLHEEFNLLPIQNYFFSNYETVLNNYNLSFLVSIPNINDSDLQKYLTQLINYHESFQIRFKRGINNKYRQYYIDKLCEVKLDVFDINDIPFTEGSEEFESELKIIIDEYIKIVRFNLEEGPLFKVIYIKGFTNRPQQLLFITHHLIFDVISQHIIVYDLECLYNNNPIGRKGTSYQQWVHGFENLVERNNSEREYWERICSFDSHSKLSKLSGASSKTTSFELNKLLTDKLFKVTGDLSKFEVQDILLCALTYALEPLSGEQYSLITLEGHGRESTDNRYDVSRTIGWFTVLYPSLLAIKDNILDTLKSIKDSRLDLPNRGQHYGKFAGYNNAQIFSVRFNYLGRYSHGGNKLWNITQIENNGLSANVGNKYLLDIASYVEDQVLKFKLTYKLHDKHITEAINNYKINLEVILNEFSKIKRNYLTLSDINYCTTQLKLDAIQTEKDIDFIFPANSLQEGFIYSSLKGNSSAYLVQQIWNCDGKLDIDLFKQAWGVAQKIYPALRLSLYSSDQNLQVINSDQLLPWEYVDLSQCLNQDSVLETLLLNDKAKGYRLDVNPLFRIYLVKLRPLCHRLVFSNHHAVSDGWSFPNLIKNVLDNYTALQKRTEYCNQRDESYILAQKYINSNQKSTFDFWDKYIQGVGEINDFNYLLKLSKLNSHHSECKQITASKEEKLVIEGDLYSSLKQLNYDYGVTINSILQFAWHTVLKIFCCSNLTTVGLIVSGRHLPIANIEDSVGLYINTLPLIVDHKENNDLSIIEVIRKIQRDINDINLHGHVLLSSIHKRNLFNSLFVYENYPALMSTFSSEDIALKFSHSTEELDYPLSVVAYEFNGSLSFILKFDDNIFCQKRLQTMLYVLNILLRQISEEPHKNLKSLYFLDQVNAKQITTHQQKNSSSDICPSTISWFESIAANYPDRIAVQYQYQSFTYEKINESANQLANYLSSKVNPGDYVVICMNKDHRIIISILAIMKLGAIYVPVEPHYPDKRIQYILDDTQAKVVLSSKQATSNKKLFSGLTVYAIDENDVQLEIEEQPKHNLEVSITDQSSIYVIYTSGTTGTPKGVVQTDINIRELFFESQSIFNFNKDDVWTLFHSCVFDFSVWEMWGALLHGGKLVIVGEEQGCNLDQFYSLVSTAKVSVLNLTPSVFYSFIEDALDSNRRNNALRYVILGGESVNMQRICRWFDIDTTAKLINMYGITEVTIHATYKLLEKTDIGSRSFIGRMLPGMYGYVMDDNLQLLPDGVVGELYIGGSGLAKEYLNLPHETEKRFITSGYTQERLYKTGDLVQRSQQGEFYYIGRNDQQVKLRGYRIELGEIENVLIKHPKVSHAAVMLHDYTNTGVLLVAFYVSKEAIDDVDLVSYLQSQLPDYMIPELFTQIALLPLTINGKLDKNALLEKLSSQDYEINTARNTMDKTLIGILSGILGLEPQSICINKSFFKYSLDSISAVKFIHLINQKSKVNVSIMDIYNFNSIKQLSDNINNIITSQKTYVF